MTTQPSPVAASSSSRSNPDVHGSNSPEPRSASCRRGAVRSISNTRLGYPLRDELYRRIELRSRLLDQPLRAIAFGAERRDVEVPLERRDRVLRPVDARLEQDDALVQERLG